MLTFGCPWCNANGTSCHCVTIVTLKRIIRSSLKGSFISFILKPTGFSCLRKLRYLRGAGVELSPYLRMNNELFLIHLHFRLIKVANFDMNHIIICQRQALSGWPQKRSTNLKGNVIYIYPFYKIILCCIYKTTV